MPDAVPENWQVFMEQYPKMISLRRQLAKRDWYVRDGWTAFIGAYHAGIYMQVFKPHWFNQTGDGIHFEMALTAQVMSLKCTSIDLHIAHKNLFDRDRFNAYTLPLMEALTKDWQGDFTLKKNTLADRVSKFVRFTETGFPKQLADGFTQLAPLGAIIDEGLAHL
jgi:hypothetical protein